MELIKGKTLIKADGSSHQADAVLSGKKVVLIYFSAHWCPPCRGFTPVLKDFYEEVKDQGVELIFVSSDRSSADMLSYMKESHGDWYGVPHGDALTNELAQKFGVSGIPFLVVLKADGSLITKDGRSAVANKGPQAVKDWL